MIEPRAVTLPKMKGPMITDEEVTMLYESATLSITIAMSFRASSIGAISLLFGWLGTLKKSVYVALKVQKSADHYTEAAMDGITILKQLAGGDPDDKKCVVKLLDNFKHSGPIGQHVCMVFKYLSDNLLSLIKYSDHRGLPLHMVKEICFLVLVGLDYLHKQLSTIHTDLKPDNILLSSMIDPFKDPRKSGAPLILPNSKTKVTSESKIDKDMRMPNGDLNRNRKKNIRKKAKQSAQGCDEKEVSVEVDGGTLTTGAVEPSPDTS